MAKGDLQGTFNDIIGRLKKAKKVQAKGGLESHEACCPAHDDDNPSFIATRTQNKILFHCRAGCKFADICKALGLDIALQDLFGGDSQKQPGYSVARLAVDRRLPIEFLQETCKLTTGERYDSKIKKQVCYVGIPYFHRDGSPHFEKQRRSLDGKGIDKFYIPEGNSNCVYGLWRLDEFLNRPDPVLYIVEGETDLWTLWWHGIPAISVPGAKGVTLVSSAMIKGFSKVYIWRDRDRSGLDFARDLSARINEFLLGTEVKVLLSADHKDPSALHVKDPDAFPQAWAEIVCAAVDPSALPAGPPPVGPPTGGGLFDGPQGQEPVGRWGFPVRSLPFGTLGYTAPDIAQRTARLYRDMMRYWEGPQMWFAYNGRYWVWSETERLPRNFAFSAVDGLTREADELGTDGDDAEARDAIHTARRRMADGTTVFNVVRHLRCEDGVLTTQDGFDRNHHLVAFQNGVYDLNAREFRAHRATDMITQLCGTAYDPDAQCPAFLKFMTRVTGGQKDLMDYLQEVVGYCLTGYTSEQCLFFVYGSGGNGKTTFLNVIETLMGDYAKKMLAETLMNGKSDRNYYDYAHLRGARMAVSSELTQDAVLNSALVKYLTGQETVRARFLNQNFFEFKPTHKLWLVGNHEPIVREMDEGTWRRIREIAFTVTIKDEEKDRFLDTKLIAELPGIAAWAVRGALRWKERGSLATPKSVTDSTEAYKQNSDILRDFLLQCTKSRIASEVKAFDLFVAYKRWSFETAREDRSMGRNSFYRNIESRGIKYRLDAEKQKYYQGIELDSDYVGSNHRRDKELEDLRKRIEALESFKDPYNLHV